MFLLILLVVILDSLFKTGKSGTQWYCVIPGTLSVPSRSVSISTYSYSANNLGHKAVVYLICGPHTIYYSDVALPGFEFEITEQVSLLKKRRRYIYFLT